MAKQENIKISVSNYGPIAKAQNIELCPLTIFMGPSNTGKSYLAVLIYALCKSLERENRLSRSISWNLIKQRNKPAFTENTMKKMAGEYDQLVDFLHQEKKIVNFDHMPEIFSKWIGKELAKFTRQALYHEVSRCMGFTEEKNLLSKDEFQFYWENPKNHLALKISNGKCNMDIKKLKIPEEGFLAMEESRRLFMMEKTSKTSKIETLLSELIEEILSNLMYDQNFAQSLYLPAGRTGMMHSYRTIAGALVQKASYAQEQDLSMPTMSGIISDLLEQIITMDTERFSDTDIKMAAEEIEKGILHGSIMNANSTANLFPQFIFQQHEQSIPLLRSSSMVSELAPIILFIKHKLSKGDLLIIEEPEAHLHPAAQRKIVGSIIRLIRAGIRVLITTHSDYFLEQLRNYILQSKLSSATNTADPKKTELSIKEEEIGAYVFREQKEGAIVERLLFDKVGGFSPEDHDDEASALYNQAAELLEQIANTQ